jgi:hypothetical protein
VRPLRARGDQHARALAAVSWVCRIDRCRRSPPVLTAGYAQRELLALATALYVAGTPGSGGVSHPRFGPEAGGGTTGIQDLIAVIPSAAGSLAPGSRSGRIGPDAGLAADPSLSG